MPDEVATFGGGEKAEGRGDQRTDVIKGPWTCGAEERLQFGEGEFDRVEIGTVGREKPQLRPDGFDGRADGGLLVGREVVEDDDIPRPQRRD